MVDRRQGAGVISGFVFFLLGKCWEVIVDMRLLPTISVVLSTDIPKSVLRIPQIRTRNHV